MYYDYLEPDPDIPRECHCCEEKERIMDVARDYIDYIVKALYSSQDMDLLKIEDNIIELCHSFGIKMPQNDLRIAKI